MNRAKGVVRKDKVALPADVHIPEGTTVTVLWDAPESSSEKPYEREPLTREDVVADLAWASRARFGK